MRKPASANNAGFGEKHKEPELPESLGEYIEDFERELRQGARDRSADTLRRLLCTTAAEGHLPGDAAVLGFVQLAEAISRDHRLNPPDKELMPKSARDRAALEHPAAGELLVYLADSMARYAESFDHTMNAGKRMTALSKAFKASGERGETRVSRELRESAEAVLHREFVKHFGDDGKILDDRSNRRLPRWERAHAKALNAAYLVLNPGKAVPAGKEHHQAVKDRLGKSYQLLLEEYPMPS